LDTSLNNARHDFSRLEEFGSLLRIVINLFTPTHHFGFESAAWYWHFLDVVWLFLFITVYWWGGIH